MSNLYPCALCGLCRYRHDVTKVPKMSNLFRINEWSLAVGDSAMRRILKSVDTKNPAYLCVEHFDFDTQFDRSGNLKQLAKPQEVSLDEKNSYDTYFNDHGYFKTTKVAFYQRKFKFQNLSCSVCSQQVRGNQMTVHAESHAPTYLNLFEHLCPEHNENRPPCDKLVELKCPKCSLLQTKAAFEISKAEAERCFPMFKFKILEFLDNGRRVYELDPEIRPEYAKGRLLNENWKPRAARTRGCSLKRPFKEEIKEEAKDPDYNYEEDLRETKAQLKMDVKEELKNEKEEIKDEDVTEIKGKRPSYTVTHPQITLQEHYQQDPHPSFEKMLQMTLEGRNPCQFNTIFRYFRTKRELDNVQCEPNDPCLRAEYYQRMESEPCERVQLSSSKRESMLEQFEHLIESGDKFTVAHSYLLAERLELPPKYLRVQFRSHKLRRTCQESRQATIREFEKKYNGVQAANLNTTHIALRVAASGVAQKRISLEDREVLEEAYQRKVQKHGNGEWPRDSFKTLAAKIGMTSDRVAKWMSSRKNKPIEEPLPIRRHVFTPTERRNLNAFYEKTPYPSPKEYRQLAERLKLSLQTVIRFFDTQRTASRKRAELNVLRDDFADIPEEKCQILAKVADENRSILVNERVELAEKLGLSYQLVTHWIELYRKSPKNQVLSPKVPVADEPQDPEDAQ